MFALTQVKGEDVERRLELDVALGSGARIERQRVLSHDRRALRGALSRIAVAARAVLSVELGAACRLRFEGLRLAACSGG
jgi:hypothetical protein